VSHAADVAAPSEVSLPLGGPLSQLPLRSGILRLLLELLTRPVRVIMTRQ
jgi:hypothetical protein